MADMIRETRCIDHMRAGPEHDSCTHPAPLTEAEPSARIHDLPQRFPGLTEADAARLVAEVREAGAASFEHEGRKWDLFRSRILGSVAIWAKPREEMDARPNRWVIPGG